MTTPQNGTRWVGNGTVKWFSGAAVVIASVIALYSWGARDARSAIVQRVKSVKETMDRHLLLGAHHEAQAQLAGIDQKFAKVLADYRALQKEMDAAIRFFEEWRRRVPATDSRQDTKLERIEEDIRNIMKECRRCLENSQ